MVQYDLFSKKPGKDKRHRIHTDGDMTPEGTQRRWEKIHGLHRGEHVLTLVPTQEECEVEKLGHSGFSVKARVTCFFWPDEGKTWRRL